jgi:hypothetical protein
MTDEHHADRRRRAFLKGVGIAGAALSASPLLTSQGIALTGVQSKTLSRGDVAILRLLAAVELIEADLWQQYAELGGVSTGAQNTYQLSLQNLDSDGSQYITSNNLDEQSHATFLNAYLVALGEEPVNLDRFRIPPSSKATGAKQIGRLGDLRRRRMLLRVRKERSTHLMGLGWSRPLQESTLPTSRINVRVPR